jgi:hypothetical protein
MKIKFLLLISVFLGILSANGQTIDSIYQSSDKMNDWGFVLTPYALLAAQSTGVDGTELRSSFSDLSSMTSAGFQLIAAIRYKRLLMLFDGTFATLGENLEQGPLKIDYRIDQKIIDLSMGYIVYDNFEFSESKPIKGWKLEADIGAKYWANDLTIDDALTVNFPLLGIDTVLSNSTSLPQNWWDLMIGLKSQFILNDRVNLGIGLKVGGFGIGNSSTFSYNFTYVNNFRVLDWLSVNVGFRNFYYKRKDPDISGNGTIETTVNVLGPILGVSFIF